MNNVIVTTPQELENLIDQSLRRILNEKSPKDKNESKSKFLTIQEASEFLNLASQTLYGYTSKGSIPFIKKGKRVLFLKSDLEKWIIQGRKMTIEEMKDKLKREGKL